MSPTDVSAVRERLAAESTARTALITGDAPDEAEVAARRDRALGELGVSAVAFQARGEVCAPVISQEMTDWVALGGSNSGCVGNAAHTYGFHRSANAVPADDYSRRRDPNGSDGPYTSWDYACAGDYYHGGKAALRARHAALLDRLMSGDPALSMICEMITMPWGDKPVMYWARWEGVANLRQYTGAGHDVWSHISLFRSRADKRPYLWRTANMPLDSTDKAWLKSAEFTTAITTALAGWKIDPNHPTVPTRTYQQHVQDLQNLRDYLVTRAGTTLYKMPSAGSPAEQLAGFDTAIVAFEARHQATVEAIEAATARVAGAVGEVRAVIERAGGNVDVAPLIARLDQLPAAIEQAATVAGDRAAGTVTARMAEGQRAAAEAVAPTSAPPAGRA
jgi:hypothetical protein